jgi:hypothetical protein
MYICDTHFLKGISRPCLDWVWYIKLSKKHRECTVSKIEFLIIPQIVFEFVLYLSSCLISWINQVVYVLFFFNWFQSSVTYFKFSIS